MRDVESLPAAQVHLPESEGDDGPLVARIEQLERKNAELETEIDRLREIDQTKSDFISILAHELNGPMTAVVGFGRILKEGWKTLPDAKRDEFFDLATRELDRLARLVQDLLDLSRIDAGSLRYDFTAVELRSVLDGLLKVHTSISQGHEIFVRLPDALPPVRADSDRLRQVLLNLLSNATGYSPPGTKVVVEAALVRADDEDFVEVSVTDEGIGIDEPDLPRVFDKFVKLKRPEWVKKGTGLGLFITKGIVEAHGGRIEVRSRKGEGSTFSVALPVATHAAH
jgi:signal transduction histidine kinase